MCKGRWVCFSHMCSVTQSCPTLLKPHGLWPLPRLLCPWDSPGKNSGVGCHFLLQGIFQPRNQTHIPCMGRQIPYHWVTWGTLLSYYTYFIFHWCWLGQCLTHIRCSQNVCWKNCESMFIVICHCPLPQLTLGKLLQSPFTVPIHGYFQPRKQL